MSPPAAVPGSLVERKQRAVRQRIIEAATELFGTQGFDNVSVSDIAAHADVGRTTFFRYFGDKSEVVFAREPEMLDAIVVAAADAPAGTARTASEAVAQLRPIVLDVCDRATADRAGYERHTELLEQHLELRARDALKLQQLSGRLSQVLIDRGTDEATAVFAAQVALACYQTARLRRHDAAGLTAAARAAFDQALDLGAARPDVS
ncbi:MAG TPA: helix-turn-helix domain-containing protein [Friedmanniella sp.]